MRYRVHKAESATAEKPPVNKLSDITVEEVSIVDRPANRRPFLVIKRAVGAAEKPAPMQISAQDKATLTRKVQAANAAIEAMTAALDGAEEAEGATVPEELTNAMDAVSKLLGKSAPPEEPKKPEAKPEAKPEGEVEKAGRKFSSANEQKLREAQKLINELLGANEPDKDDHAVPETAATAKAETKPDAATAAALNSLTDTVSTLIRAVKAQKSRIDQLTTSTPGSRQVNTEKSDDDEKPREEESFSWPMDMNRPHTRANTPVEKSFFEG